MGYRVKLPPFRAEGENAIDGSPIPEKVVIPVITGDLSAEPFAPPPVTRQERWAELDAEEALFRVWWRTLPDKNLARRTWHSTLTWYCEEKSLELEMQEALQQRVQDLWQAPYHEHATGDRVAVLRKAG